MRKSGEIVPQVWGIQSPKLGEFWRGRYPQKTAVEVAAALGAPVRTVENWLDGASAMSLRWFLQGVGVWGPDFLAACFEAPPAWLDAAARAAQRERLESEIALMQARLDASSVRP